MQFTLHFKKKKVASDSIAILKQNYTDVGVIFSTYLGKDPIQSAEPLPIKLPYDSRMVMTHLGKYKKA